MAIPRFIPGRNGGRPHYAMPNGQWVAAPQAGFFQPPRRSPSMGGFSQVRPNPNAGFTQVRPPNPASQFTQLRPPRQLPRMQAGNMAPQGAGRSSLIQAMIQAAMAHPDAISPAGTPGAGMAAPAVNGVGDIDAYLMWLMTQGARGPRSAPQGY